MDKDYRTKDCIWIFYIVRSKKNNKKWNVRTENQRLIKKLCIIINIKYAV